MSVRFVFARSWRSLADLPEDLSCPAGTVGAALTWLCDRYPPLRRRVFSEDGALALWMLVCLDDIDVRALDGLATPTGTGDHELHLLNALMGG